MSNTQCAAGAHAFSNELSGSRSGGSLKEPAEGRRKEKKGQRGSDREAERETEKDPREIFPHTMVRRETVCGSGIWSFLLHARRTSRV